MLKARQVQAATLLAQGILCKGVAEAVGVTAQTISNWQKDPHFEALLNQIKLEALEASRARVQSLAQLAVATLENILQEGSSDAIRLKAVEVVFAHVGLTQGHTSLWRWGLGGLSKQAVLRERSSASQNERMLAEIVDSMR